MIFSVYMKPLYFKVILFFDKIIFIGIYVFIYFIESYMFSQIPWAIWKSREDKNTDFTPPDFSGKIVRIMDIREIVDFLLRLETRDLCLFIHYMYYQYIGFLGVDFLCGSGDIPYSKKLLTEYFQENSKTCWVLRFCDNKNTLKTILESWKMQECFLSEIHKDGYIVEIVIDIIISTYLKKKSLENKILKRKDIVLELILETKNILLFPEKKDFSPMIHDILHEKISERIFSNQLYKNLYYS